MYLARVIGNVVSTRKVPGLDGIRLLLVQPVAEDGKDRGKPLTAADVTQAGPGDLVHVTSSREAALAMPDPFVPVDAAIIAIVDRVDGVPADDLLAAKADAAPIKPENGAKPKKRAKS